MILVQETKKHTRRSKSQSVRLHAVERRPIDPNVFYTIREITDKQSPWYVASASTIFRALREGRLTANYLGRAVRLKGIAILTLIEGKGGAIA